MKYVKLYGEMRTATNYVRGLFETNFHCTVLMNVLGWKHGEPQDWRDWLSEYQHREWFSRLYPVLGQIAVVVVTKDPYAWVCSMLDYRESQPAWKGRVDRRDTSEVGRLCRRYNSRYRSWLNGDLPYCSRVEVVRHEALLQDFRAELARLGEALGIYLPGQNLSDFEDAALPSIDTLPTRRGETWRRRQYYLGRQYLERLAPEAVDTITAETDWRLLEKLGYGPVI